jgi:23S rRNA (adenine2503-C2)-methyltransferase
MKPSLSGVPLAELEALLAPLPRYRAKQVFEWINAGCGSFEAMNNLPLALRSELDGRFVLRKTRVERTLDGTDATKLQIAVDGGTVEAVILADGAGRQTACLSTQLGCPMACVFCKTGSLGLSRSLDSAEITEQFYHVRARRPAIGSIVFMGMGEPLLNLGELRRALGILCGLLSVRRITISTCGIVDGIVSLADSGPAVRLAVSLTTAREGLRKRLMPAAAKSPLSELKAALLYHQRKIGRRVTLEAALLGGVNTGAEDADALAAFADGLDAAVNLIPWNPVAGLSFDGKPLVEPSAAETARFRAALESRGLTTLLRRRKGRAICGACGQLGHRLCAPLSTGTH